MIEVELKFEVLKKDIKPLARELIKHGLKKLSRVHETTTMYDTPDKFLKKNNDGRLRLRKNWNPQRRFLECILSYKKPLKSKDIKREEELEANISDYRNFERILQLMNFSPVSSYEKYRTTFKNTFVKATIDEYPFATFLELEGDEIKIKEFARILGLNFQDNLIKPVDTLFQEWRKKQGLMPQSFLKFKDYDK